MLLFTHAPNASGCARSHERARIETYALISNVQDRKVAPAHMSGRGLKPSRSRIYSASVRCCARSHERARIETVDALRNNLVAGLRPLT